MRRIALVVFTFFLASFMFVSAASAAPDDKVWVCHSETGVTFELISISENGMNGHITHEFDVTTNVTSSTDCSVFAENPTPVPTEEVTPTPEPTETPVVTPEPTEIPTTPTPDVTPDVTPTPDIGTPTPDATETPEPTVEPTETPTEIPTVEPTEEPTVVPTELPGEPESGPIDVTPTPDNIVSALPNTGTGPNDTSNHAMVLFTGIIGLTLVLGALGMKTRTQ